MIVLKNDKYSVQVVGLKTDPALFLYLDFKLILVDTLLRLVHWLKTMFEPTPNTGVPVYKDKRPKIRNLLSLFFSKKASTNSQCIYQKVTYRQNFGQKIFGDFVLI